MSDNIIVAPGSAPVNLQCLGCAAAEFGWTVKFAQSVLQAASGNVSEIAAIILHKSAVGEDCSWPEAILHVKSVLPGVACIVCHGFSEPIDWPALSAAGAFHAVWLPLRQSEIRKSLGFVSEARQRLASPIPMPQRLSTEPDSPPSAPLSGGSHPPTLPSRYLH